ncbi:MAG: phosphoribosylglycinamide formyltransferase [bacterium]|jgi:phosphoribosylglycinamide formyltransferase-1|nr:phosphoribosylglycinamide formyltransferase [Betaproteobacteria bacterium]
MTPTTGRDGATGPSVVVLISGRGSNLRAIVESQPPCRIAAVISNRPDAAGLAYARGHGIATEVVDHGAFAAADDPRAAFDAALRQAIDRHQPALVVLAGFMRILTAPFVDHYAGRMINIHPSLLPAYPGLHTHRRALAEGVRLHGCTVHFVTSTLDNGPIIVQAAVPVHAGDTEDTLSARVLVQEHRLYPQAVRWFVQGRLSIEGSRVRLAPPAGSPVPAQDGTLVVPPLD